MVIGLLTACTPGIPYAWRLNADGTVSFSFCGEKSAAKLEVTYYADSVEVAKVVSAGPTAEFGAGIPISEVREGWLSAARTSPTATWDRFEFVLLDAAFPEGSVHPVNGSDRSDGLFEVDGWHVKRSDLKLGAWVWDSGFNMSQPSCSITETPSLDGFGEAERVAIGADAAAGLLDRAQGSTGVLVSELVTAGIPSLLAFQSELQLELHANAQAAETLEAASSRLFGNPDALLAAPAAARQLGYTWDPRAMPLYDWASQRFPDASPLVLSEDPFDELLVKR